MEWWLKLILIWLSLDVLLVATGWFLITTIKPRYSRWWQRNIADEYESN